MQVRAMSDTRYLWRLGWIHLDWSDQESVARIANLGGVRWRIDRLLGRVS